jgi:hypothetical protein
MKRLWLLVLFLFLAVPVFANYVPKNSELGTTDWKNTTITIYGTTQTYEMTLDAGSVVYFDLYADGGDLCWSKDGSTTEASYKIASGSTYHDDNAYPINTTFKFWSLTAGMVARMRYGYR